MIYDVSLLSAILVLTRIMLTHQFCRLCPVSKTGTCLIETSCNSDTIPPYIESAGVDKSKYWRADSDKSAKCTIYDKCRMAQKDSSVNIKVLNRESYIKIIYKGGCGWIKKNAVYCDCCKLLPDLSVFNSKPNHVIKGPSTSNNQLDTYDLKQCSKLDLITSLMHVEDIHTSGLMCKDGLHGLSESILTNRCNAPPSDKWKRGRNVLKHCSDIPRYTAVAAFSNIYTHDGIAGAFVGCNSTVLKIISQDCTRSISIFYLTTSRASYSLNAINFYTVYW